MQLTNPTSTTLPTPSSVKPAAKQWKNIAMAVTQASALLLGQQALAQSPDSTVNTSASAAATDYTAPTNPWKISLATLGYSEADGRVTAVEPVVNVSKDLGDEHIFNLKVAVDTLTGATPYGAATANVPQVLSSPSGGASGSQNGSENEDENEGGSGGRIPAGQLPLDTSFKDTRVAVNVGWSQPLSERLKGSIAANVSNEYDFTSLGVNSSLTKDYNDKNTTLTGGLALEYDQIKPVGGAPVANTLYADARKEGSKTKTVIEGMVGLTQLLSPRSLVQVNYALSSSQGYMTDPYKIVTVVDASGKLIPTGTADTYTYLYESRPDTRLRHALYGEYKYHFDNSIASAAYRFTTDDWGVSSHTIDSKWRFNLSQNGYFVEPHVRVYQQSAADFYHGYLKVGDTVSQQGSQYTPIGGYASADHRLGGFSAHTLGFKVGKSLGEDNELSLRVEQYTQTPEDKDRTSVGDLANKTTQADLKATLLQLSYSFTW